MIGQLLHLRVLEVAPAEPQNGEEDAGLALLLDETDEVALAGQTHVEVAVGGQDHPVDSAVHEALRRDAVGELDPGATRGGPSGPETSESRLDPSLLGAEGRRQDEPRGPGVDHDRHAVLLAEGVDEQAHGPLQERELVRGVHGPRDVEEERQVARGQILVVDRAAAQTNEGQAVLGLPGAHTQLGRDREGRAPFRLRIVVSKVVDELLDADRTLRRELTRREEAAHVGVRGRVHVDREGREGVRAHRQERVVADVVVALAVEVGRQRKKPPLVLLHGLGLEPLPAMSGQLALVRSTSHRGYLRNRPRERRGDVVLGRDHPAVLDDPGRGAGLTGPLLVGSGGGDGASS